MNQADLWPNMPMMDGDRTIPCRCDRRIHVSKNHGREDWTRNEWRLFRAALLALELYALGAASSRTAGAFDYAYDPIGNRTSATEYDESGAPLFAEYAANSLNQYTQRTVPGYAAVRGEADTNAFVTVNERPVSRVGAYFHGGDYADNTLSNLYHDLEIYAAINPPGTNTPDPVYAVTTSVFVAKTPETFTYDADGNMTSDGRFTYTWNADNRMVMASNDAVVVTYAYDHRGRMVRKEISRGAAEPQSIFYTWDNWNIVRETHVSRLDSRVTHNVWGLDLDGTLQGAGGVGGLLAVIVPRPMGEGQGEGGTAYLPCHDANGNITEYVSTNGEVVAHYDYSPFGETLIASGPLASTFTHRFSTKPWCTDTGLVEYQMRKFRPNIGHWMSRDMFEDFSGNSFHFCGNSPISHYDYLGEDAPNLGGPLFPPPPPQSIPPDKPRQCGMCCTTEEGQDGIYECKWTSNSGVVTGGAAERRSHDAWKNMKPQPKRDGLTKWWNPTLCFEMPQCDDGWMPQNNPPLLINKGTCDHLLDDDGRRRGSAGAPDHEGKNRYCYELNSRPWGDWSWKKNHDNKELGIWCMKCVAIKPSFGGE